MAEKLTAYDPAAALVDDDEVAAFLADALETGDVAFIAKSLGVVARAKGMTEADLERRLYIVRKRIESEAAWPTSAVAS